MSAGSVDYVDFVKDQLVSLRSVCAVVVLLFGAQHWQSATLHKGGQVIDEENKEDGINENIIATASRWIISEKLPKLLRQIQLPGLNNQLFLQAR